MSMSSIATVMLGGVFINGGAVIVPSNVVQLASENRCAASLSCSSPRSIAVTTRVSTMSIHSRYATVDPVIPCSTLSRNPARS